MKALALIIVLGCWGLLAWATMDFPAWGDPSSPASGHVSAYYITKTMDQTSVPNLVTAVLADYRGYDTMFETAVIFAAGVACFFLLRYFRREDPEDQMFRHRPSGVTVYIKSGWQLKDPEGTFDPLDREWAPHDLITKASCRIMIPFIQLFALYVVAHGHHSPGGGFQGGVIMGASLVLLALSHDLRAAKPRLMETLNGILSSGGVFIYAGVGALCLLFGANFLDYSGLAGLLGVDRIHARSLGILFVEIGVAIAVMATMFLIYRVVASGGADDEGL